MLGTWMFCCFHFWATLSLIVAAGIKLWPIILLPFVLLAWHRYNPQNLVRRLLQTALLIAVGCLIMLPQIVGSVAPTSGIVVYSESWQTNAFLFGLIKSGFETFTDIDADPLSRWSVVLCLAAFGLFRFRTRFLSRTRSRQSKTSHQDLLALTACLFFLSPTGYPWYMPWFSPWLVISPSLPLLLLAVTLPLYDLRYILATDSNLFESVIVPLQFLPSLIWLAWQLIQGQLIQKQLKQNNNTVGSVSK